MRVAAKLVLPGFSSAAGAVAAVQLAVTKHAGRAAAGRGRHACADPCCCTSAGGHCHFAAWHSTTICGSFPACAALHAQPRPPWPAAPQQPTTPPLPDCCPVAPAHVPQAHRSRRVCGCGSQGPRLHGGGGGEVQVCVRAQPRQRRAADHLLTAGGTLQWRLQQRCQLAGMGGLLLTIAEQGSRAAAGRRAMAARCHLPACRPSRTPLPSLSCLPLPGAQGLHAVLPRDGPGHGLRQPRVRGD